MTQLGSELYEGNDDLEEQQIDARLMNMTGKPPGLSRAGVAQLKDSPGVQQGTDGAVLPQGGSQVGAPQHRGCCRFKSGGDMAKHNTAFRERQTDAAKMPSTLHISKMS